MDGHLNRCTFAGLNYGARQSHLLLQLPFVCSLNESRKSDAQQQQNKMWLLAELTEFSCYPKYKGRQMDNCFCVLLLFRQAVITRGSSAAQHPVLAASHQMSSHSPRIFSLSGQRSTSGSQEPPQPQLILPSHSSPSCLSTDGTGKTNTGSSFTHRQLHPSALLYHVSKEPSWLNQMIP